MFDLVIRDATVVDGTGSAPFEGSIAIREGRIVSVGDSVPPARDQIDASGLVLSPGFIDMHSHSEPILIDGSMLEPKSHQGVTTAVIGQDGIGLLPNTTAARDLYYSLSPEADEKAGWTWSDLAELGNRANGRMSLNVASLVPHASVRASAMGFTNRAPTIRELDSMRAETDKLMAGGAFGLSAGLTYAPGMFADDTEIVALAEVAAQHGGYYSPHHRSYGVGALTAYRECIDIANASGVRLHLTHASLMHAENQDSGPALLHMVDEANDAGTTVTLDSYPYTAAEGTLGSMLPGWMHDGGPEQAMIRLFEPETVERLRDVMEVLGSDGFQGAPVPWERIQIGEINEPRLRGQIGKTIAEVADEVGQSPFDAFLVLLKEDNLQTTFIEHTAYEENVRTIMRHPSHVFGSDGAVGPGYVHPRAFGTFPRVLGRYVRDLGILTLPQAIHKMTGGPAAILGLRDRGVIAEGFVADLVCFDPNSVIDRATYLQPRILPTGIRDVFVAGQSTVRDGRLTGLSPGVVLRA